MSHDPAATAAQHAAASRSDKLKFRLLGVVVLIALLACVAPFVVTEHHARLPKSLHITAKTSPAAPAIASATANTTDAAQFNTTQSFANSNIQSAQPTLIALKPKMQPATTLQPQSLKQASRLTAGRTVAHSTIKNSAAAVDARATIITIKNNSPATITVAAAPDTAQAVTASSIEGPAAKARSSAHAQTHTSAASLAAAGSKQPPRASSTSSQPSQPTTAVASAASVTTTSVPAVNSQAVVTSTVTSTTPSATTAAPTAAPAATHIVAAHAPSSVVVPATQPKPVVLSNSSTAQMSAAQPAPEGSPSLPSTLSQHATPDAWLIQLGTFSKSSNAQALQQRLQQAGYAVIIAHTLHRQGHDLWQVMVAAHTRPSARQLQKQLQARFALAGYIKKNPYS